jgi:hypothetical protein
MSCNLLQHHDHGMTETSGNFTAMQCRDARAAYRLGARTTRTNTMRKSLLLSPIFLWLTATSLFAASPPAKEPLPSVGEPSVYAASTVRQFLTACTIDQGACVDEVGTALMDKMDYTGTSNVCIQSPDYGGAVPKWLSAHPETSNMATEDGIYLAIKTLYPCA